MARADKHSTGGIGDQGSRSCSPRMVSSLSACAGVASPLRRTSLDTGDPQLATIGASRSETLSQCRRWSACRPGPIQPVEVSRSPDSSIASVSARALGRQATQTYRHEQCRHLIIGHSSAVYSRMSCFQSDAERGFPSRLCWIRDGSPFVTLFDWTMSCRGPSSD